MKAPRVVALAGGVGGAKLVLGLANSLQPGELVVGVNTGDDEDFHGLHVSPDLDTIMYTLAGLSNPDTAGVCRAIRSRPCQCSANMGLIPGSIWVTRTSGLIFAGLSFFRRG